MLQNKNNQQTALAHWLVLHRTAGIGPSRLQQLLSVKGGLSDLFLDKQPTPLLSTWLRRWHLLPWEPDWAGVQKDLDWLAQSAQHHILTITDSGYPPALKTISAPPPLLYVWGDIDVLSRAQLAMVGSRHPTVYGKKVAFSFAEALSKAGLVITSGLAQGIDAASHEGALNHSGLTIAVLGSGLDDIYPKRHQDLASKISKRGAVISEFPIGTGPKPAHFPRRNRLISGLSQGVFVVESTLKSGSLITANYALEQGREVFTIPGSIHSPLSKGCHQLIRQGAKCVDAVEHILEEMQFPPHQSTCLPSKQYTQKEKRPSEADHLLVYINEFCTSIDEIVDQTGLTPSVVSPMLLALELAGSIGSVPGGYIRLTTGG